MKLMAAIIVFLLGQLAYSAQLKWAGYDKSDVTVQVRYVDSVFGFALGFKFPKHPNDSDRLETLELFERNGCYIFEGGGYAGAEVFAVCKGVTDAASADVMLKAFVPKLAAHMRSLK